MTTTAPTVLSTDLLPVRKASTAMTRTCAGIVALGVLLSAAALFDADSRVRFEFGYLLGFSFIWSIMLGSLFFVGLQHITHSVWSVLIRRTAEALASPVIMLAALFLPILVFSALPGTFHLFPWADATIVEGDHLLEAKSAYLNVPFFAIRAAFFFAVWITFSRIFVGRSLRQDKGVGGVSASVSMRKLSAPFMLLFAATVTFASFDWLMSLNPYWFSTMFGVYVFAGLTVASLAAMTLLTIWLMYSGRLGTGLVTGDHLYSLGALLFAFTCFWGYVAFSQYMLIWYANMPEEAFYIHNRIQGGWLTISLLLALMRFVLPFLLLLSRRSKMSPRILAIVSVLVLAGQGLDLYWLIMPELHTEGPGFGWQELGPVLLCIGLMLLLMSRFFSKHTPIPIGDPLLDACRRFHL